MLSICKNFIKILGQAKRQFEQEISSSGKSFLNVSGCCARQIQNFHTSTPRKKVDVALDIRKAAKESQKKTLVVEDFNLDMQSVRNEGVFPTVNLPDTLFDGVPFKELPIIYIKVSRNNTILNLVDEGFVKVTRSCGTEGFKNSRKGTNIAAQTAGTALAMRALKKGYKTVRVIIRGLGPGRLSGIKGIQLSGMNVVSITDTTKDFTHLRPRKQRRI